MCGIAGILWSGAQAPQLETPLRAMQRALRHRGPDDEGMFLSPSAPRSGEIDATLAHRMGEGLGVRASAPAIGLVHTRLSILDLSPAGHQPMTTADGRFTIVFNGEIYNFRTLREQLAATGVEFRSHSDTEVILRCYERYGPECVMQLRGMFTFAIWDERERTCFLARDPLGIKPLYIARTKTALVFASELRAVIRSGLVEKHLDAESVFGFFQTGSVPEPGTLLRDVEMLGAGSWLLWRNGEATRNSYWQVNFPAPDGARVADAKGHVREALVDSVRRHFVSDVPVGVFLSGGIDSTAVVALSRATGQSDLRTFSISFREPEFDEGSLAQQTATHFKTQHADWRLESDEGRGLFGEFLKRFDQPSIDGFNTFCVSRFAHRQGVKVVLSGLGGDEMFGGYPTFRRVPQMIRWGRCAAQLLPVRQLAASVLRKSNRPQLRRLGGFLDESPTARNAYRAYRGVFSTNEARALTQKLTGAAPKQTGLETEERPQPTLEDDVGAMELQLYMRNQLLRDSDVMSMAWGLELRVPFVDQALFESVARIPASLRLRAGKQMLLEAVPEVPEWVWNRPKRGFRFPFQQWIESGWRDVFDDAIRRSGCQAQTWYQAWAIFVFDHWRRQNSL